ncbi:SDR family NAD(P)-dependent oxidoreductase [Chryseobacterium caseinilyticum]|uniref:SDR family oxidoreductase n=1 Tax=Chryseobacterium caseinilyticum TaxID=2771428 RepID=A0ABR8ZAI6_9FLAO|nr:SDR family NAD(P)-dependent oxidoreductase [Chryseobacterium caseinilyticum]MBD8082324.1 SDR family oxidoreductase [Chryseobacterium caseinilyticum]
MIIITSASRGIGKFLFEKLRYEGKEVIGFYNNTVPEITDGYYRLDITNEEQTKAFFIENRDKFKNIVLINTAGISYNSFGHKADLTQWKNVIDVNLVGCFNMINTFLGVMREDNFGRIINFASVVGQKGIPGTSAYASSKSALWGMSRALAVENGNKNVTINNINLGYFNIGMIEQVPENYMNTLVESIPAKRLGNPEEILSTVKFIIDNAYLNGASIDLNGGLF